MDTRTLSFWASTLPDFAYEGVDEDVLQKIVELRNVGKMVVGPQQGPNRTVCVGPTGKGLGRQIKGLIPGALRGGFDAQHLHLADVGAGDRLPGARGQAVELRPSEQSGHDEEPGARSCVFGRELRVRGW